PQASCLLLCPLPLRERAARTRQRIRLGEGYASRRVPSYEEDPSPNFLRGETMQPSPATGEGTIISASRVEPSVVRSPPSSSRLRVACLPHGGDGLADLVAQQAVELLADVLERVGEHEIGRAWVRLRHRDARLDLAGPRRHHHDTVGEEDGLCKRMG